MANLLSRLRSQMSGQPPKTVAIDRARYEAMMEALGGVIELRCDGAGGVRVTCTDPDAARALAAIIRIGVARATEEGCRKREAALRAAAKLEQL